MQLSHSDSAIGLRVLTTVVRPPKTALARERKINASAPPFVPHAFWARTLMPSTRASSRAPADAAVAVASAAAVTTCNPRTASGKKASAAALEREHEYVDWLAGLPEPARDDEPRDDSWAAFMKERRRRKEKERLRNIEDQRTA